MKISLFEKLPLRKFISVLSFYPVIFEEKKEPKNYI